MKVLPFYTSTAQRDAEKVNSQDALLCPTYKLLPFQIQRLASGSTGLTSALLVDCNGATTNVLSDLTLETAERTTYDFITYNGEPLANTLAYGVYYLRVADGNTTWYSEWINVQNIQPALFSGYSSDSYDTFTTSGANITSGINLAGGAAANSDGFTGAYTNEKFIFTYNLTLNSGEAPYVLINDGVNHISASQQLSAGVNEIEITATGSDNTLVFLRIQNSAASNFSLGSVSLRRKSGEYVHIEYTNSKDFNNGDESILYTSTGGFTQQAYLRAYENLPSHESIEIGEDKNGKFVAEKLIRKYTRSVVSYESRSMYNALSLLKNHDTIKILTEDGIEYTPAIGNVDVSIDWNTFDTGSLRIAWNEDGNVWTNSMDNIV